MMRVLQIIDTLLTGGAERLQVTFAEAVRARDVQLTVVSLRSGDSPIPALLESLGVTVHMMPAPKLFYPPRLRQLWGLLRREQFDVIHSHLAYANILAALLGRLTSIPVVASLHNTVVSEPGVNPAQTSLETAALRFGARRVIAVGNAVAEAHRERLKGKAIDIIPNAVQEIPPLSDAERAALRAEITGDAARPLLISVGRLWPQKGYGDLLTAFAQVHRAYPSAALAVVGTGILYDELAAQIAALGLQGHVFLLGMRSDVPALLAASDLYVNASHWEGLPVAVLEAMSAGLAVAATAVGDVPHAVIEGTGVLVPPQNPALLAEAICKLLSQPDCMHAMGAAAKAHVSRRYGVDTWADQILQLYQTVIH